MTTKTKSLSVKAAIAGRPMKRQRVKRPPTPVSEMKTRNGRISGTISEIIRKRLQKLYKESGMTLNEVAIVAGTSRQAVEQQIGGYNLTAGMTLGNLYTLAFAFKVEPSALLPTIGELEGKGMKVKTVELWEIDI